MKVKIKEVPVFSDHERFLSKIKVNQESGCWEWQKALTNSGYGKFHIINGDYMTHRVSYSIFKEGLNTDLVVDHICKNRKCCNPNHLRLASFSENVLENSDSGAAINKSKTHCIRGHELIPPNIISSKMKSGQMSRCCRHCFNNQRRIRRKNGSKH